MEMIVRGNPQELDFIRRVCRDKIRRGLITLLPAVNQANDMSENDIDSKDVRLADSKEVHLDDVKQVMPPNASRSKRDKKRK